MIPDDVLKMLYLSKEFYAMPCVFQSMAIDAFENALKQTNKVIKEDKDATIHKS